MKGKRISNAQKLEPAIVIHCGSIRHGAGRTSAEMQQMLNKVPASERAGVDGQSAAHKVKEYLFDKDTSHIKSHNRGGSGHSDDIKWEDKSINRARGDRTLC